MPRFYTTIIWAANAVCKEYLCVHVFFLASEETRIPVPGA